MLMTVSGHGIEVGHVERKGRRPCFLLHPSKFPQDLEGAPTSAAIDIKMPSHIGCRARRLRQKLQCTQTVPERVTHGCQSPAAVYSRRAWLVLRWPAR